MTPELIRWITSEVLPHEAVVRGWLRRNGITACDEDDLIQEAYARLSKVREVERIGSGRAYFFTTVKNLIRERVRRDRIVRIELAETQLQCIEDDEPSPERRFSSRQQLALVQRFIEELPEPCRSVVRLRKIHGVSQRETAERLGLSENVIEKQIAAAIRTLLARLNTEAGRAESAEAPRYASRESKRVQRRDR